MSAAIRLLCRRFRPSTSVPADGCDVARPGSPRRHPVSYTHLLGSGGSARLVTPELSGSLLPGITRDSLLQLAIDAGFSVEERKIDIDEWQKKAAAGEITEVFACGTAAVITPVSEVKYGDGDFTIADGEPGEVTMALRDTLTGIQRGTFADTHGWMARLG